MLVAVTAMEGPDPRRRTTAGGFHLHLVKPVDPQKLLLIVDDLWRIMTQPAAPISRAPERNGPAGAEAPSDG